MKMNVKCQKGFTLIELLVVIVILVVLGSIITGVITFSLRGTNKANTIENIRQSGNYAISQIGKTIEYAKDFGGLSNDDGVTYETSCPATLSPAPTSSSYKYIKITTFNSSSIIYSCSNVGGFETIAYEKPPDGAVSFIDNSVIKVVNCSFTCTVSSVTDPPIINISFLLEPATTSTLVEKVATPIIFETSVTMRNYQR